jgi:hypothetical protein
LTAIGGLASAVLSISAVVVVVVKWIQKSSDQIGPILFAGAGLATSILILLFGLWVLTFGRSRIEPGERIVFVVNAVMGAGLLVAALLAGAVPTLLHGRYDGSKDVIVITGLIGMLGVAGGLIGGAIGYAAERRRPDWAPRGKQLCPDCAEYPKKAAKVCRYCGHRFDPAEPQSSA